jgi:hypothetical protein
VTRSYVQGIRNPETHLAIILSIDFCLEVQTKDI